MWAIPLFYMFKRQHNSNEEYSPTDYFLCVLSRIQKQIMAHLFELLLFFERDFSRAVVIEL
jgi:hypothetical protein